MYEGYARRGRAETRNRRPRAAGIGDRPDRVALWAVFLGLFALVVAASTAQAGTGGTSPGGTTSTYSTAQFGDRVLREGLRGSDVRILNGFMMSKRYGTEIPFGGDFENPTTRAVRTFQRRVGLSDTGVVRRATRTALVHSIPRANATWYGPGFYGNRTACGRTMSKDLVGVAHKSLPCGTRVTFAYKGRYLTTRVVDRGPYVKGVAWDLTYRAAQRLNFTYSDSVRSGIAAR
jgi:peptidoglycan hydrolase-like protein with peptidoglycan-binding domain